MERPLADLHSHLVPGVDDGARTAEDTLDSLDRLTAAGVSKVITTPHLEASLTLDPPALEARLEEVDAAWESVAPRIATRFPELEIRRGFELMLDVPDADFTHEALRLGETSYILVEWPRMQVPPHSAEVLSRLRFAGLRPVVAHPERYHGLDPDLDVVRAWREAGAHLQVNHGSLAGRYGPGARTAALRLLGRGWVDFLSTDFHARSHLGLYLTESRERLAAAGAEELFFLLAGTNVLRVFEDEPPLPVPPIEADQGLWGRLRELLTGADR